MTITVKNEMMYTAVEEKIAMLGFYLENYNDALNVATWTDNSHIIKIRLED